MVFMAKKSKPLTRIDQIAQVLETSQVAKIRAKEIKQLNRGGHYYGIIF